MKNNNIYEAHLEVDGEAVISVRGQDKYVVMDIEKYAKLREYELEIALQEARADMDAGRLSTGNVDEYMKQISDEL